jgi:basic amino acid/polyamine antiporter, APA family
MAFTKYLAPFGLQDNLWLAIGVIVLIGLMHSFTIKHSSRFQNISTIIKIVFIVVLILIGVFVTNTHAANAIVLDNSWHKDIVSPGFAVSMVYVSFAYVGWNAAAYVVDEIDNPRKNLPKALIGSALFVSVVYVLFQIVLLKNATASALVGKEEVTYIAFNNLLGSTGGKWVSVFIAIQLVATISSYLWVGPRVTHAMASEHKLWQPLAKKNKHGIPVMAVWVHVVIAIILALTGSFEKILLYAGFVLQLMASLTVATSLFIKNKNVTSFTSPLKPVLQIIFLLFNVGVLIFTFIDRPLESLIGIGILLLGLVIYYFDKPTKNALIKEESSM